MYTGPFLVVAATLIQIPVAGFMHSFGIFVKKLDDEFCPGDCLQELGKYLFLSLQHEVTGLYVCGGGGGGGGGCGIRVLF